MTEYGPVDPARRRTRREPVTAHEILRWEEPPAARTNNPRGPQGRDPWSNVAAQLQLNIGRWAVVWEGESRGSAASLAHQIRNGARAGFEPAGAFDAVTRVAGQGRNVVYARALEVEEW